MIIIEEQMNESMYESSSLLLLTYHLRVLLTKDSITYFIDIYSSKVQYHDACNNVPYEVTCYDF